MKLFEDISNAIGVFLLIFFLFGLFIGVPALREKHGDTLVTQSGYTIPMDDYEMGIIIFVAALTIGTLWRSRLGNFLAFVLFCVGIWYWLSHTSGW